MEQNSRDEVVTLFANHMSEDADLELQQQKHHQHMKQQNQERGEDVPLPVHHSTKGYSNFQKRSLERANRQAEQQCDREQKDKNDLER